jgi:hypothetical protein
MAAGKGKGRAQKEKRGPAVSANSSSLSRARAYHPKTADRCVLRRRLFPPRATLGQKFAKAGTPSEAPGPNAVTNAIGYAEHCSRSHDAVVRVYDNAGNVIETHEQGRRKSLPVS